MKGKVAMQKRNLFQNQLGSLVLILMMMIVSAFLICQLIPSPVKDVIGAKQAQANACTLSMECSKK